MAITFWLLCACVAYVYVGYPLLLRMWGQLWPRRIAHTGAGPEPTVSFVIAGRNEGRRIAARVSNITQLDYPADKRQVVIVDDGSTDDTRDVLRRLKRNVEAIQVRAGGKARALNAGVAAATNDILVFADMRQGFAPDALKALVAPFADPTVGAVSGELVLNGEHRDRRADERRARLERREMTDRRLRRRLAASQRKGSRRWTLRRDLLESTVVDGVGMYWRYEKQIRRDESACGSIVGATGAIYAMRRSLWEPLPPDTILDDVLTPMRCVMKGYRVVFEERACAFDRTAADANAEGRRKLRTLAGNYQLLWLEPRLLLPWSNPAWIQFVSHKMGRLLVPYALPMLLVLSMMLATRSFIYTAAFAAQCVFYGLAAYGALLEHTPKGGVRSAAPPINRLARVALMFLVMNGSAVAGLVALLTRQKVWR